MQSGGVSKSLSSLLNVIDTDTYDVDCFILSPTGLFMDLIPPEINILSDRKTALFFSGMPYAPFRLFKKGYFKLTFYRLIAALWMRFDRSRAAYFLAKGISKINKHYDLAVDYNGQQQLVYLINSVQADKKVSFFHSDYKKWSAYYKSDKRYMPLVNRVFTVSEKCVDSLKSYFPEINQKINLFENISSPALLQRFAAEPVDDTPEKDNLILLTVGRITQAKGIDLAIEAAALLKKKGVRLRWYFMGRCPSPNPFENLAKNLGLEKEIIFMGPRINPYPYMRLSDLIVHPSRFEGKSIALDEAKLLCKPIVVTNFSTVGDQFTDRVNASVSLMNPESLAEKIWELVQDSDLRNRYISALQLEKKDNSDEIKKLYAFLKD